MNDFKEKDKKKTGRKKEIKNKPKVLFESSSLKDFRISRSHRIDLNDNYFKMLSV